jgi:hypothetical protein
MKKQDALGIMLVAGVVCLFAGLGGVTATISPWLAGIVIVVTFPVFVLFLGLWWNASEGDEDIPFIGY